MQTVDESFVNFYEILPGIVETSNGEAIRKAIREQRQIWNKRAAQADPVKREIAQKRIRNLGEAERILLDKDKKRAFDQQVRNYHPQDDTVAKGSTGVRDWMSDAREYFNHGNFAAAYYAAREAITTNGANHEAWSIRANSSFNLGNFTDAGFEFREAIRLKPDNASYYLDYGDAFSQLGDLVNARGMYESALRIEPGNPLYRTAVASIMMQTGEIDPALQIMEDVVKEFPDEKFFQYYLALAIEAVQDSKLSVTNDKRLIITSEAQIELVRNMSTRALQLKFDDDPLRKTLQHNLDLAEQASSVKWYHSSIGGWIFLLLISMLFIAAHGIGVLFMIIVISLYVVTHRRPVWKQNSKNLSIVKRGI
jgi:Flp pilus assembly protein TadD